MNGCAVLVVLILAAPAFAQTSAEPVPSDYLNRYLPEWLQFSGEGRVRYEGFTGLGFQPSSDDDHLLTRVRVNVRVHPWAHLTLFAQGQDARVFSTNIKPVPPNYQDTFDLRIGYAELGDSEQDPVSIRAGRQELNFGEQRLIGYNGWRNTAQSFDAVRLMLHFGWARIDMFVSAPVTIQDRFNRPVPGNNLHGVYGTMASRRRHFTLEPYLIWRLSPAWRVEAGGFGRLSVGYIGAHLFGKKGDPWDYDIEVVTETGSSGSDSIRAWAGHWRAGYTSPGRIPVRWLAEYNHASGDRYPEDGRQGGFTAPYPSVHDRYGLADQVGWKNIHHVRTGAEIHVAPRWEVIPNIHNYWLASRTDGLFTPSNVQLARVEKGARSNRVGWEADLSAVWKINALLEAGVGFAHLFPGDFLREATPGVPYNYGYCLLNFRF